MASSQVFILVCFLLVAAATRSVESACTPDSYSNLPAAPVFPTSTLPAAQTPTPTASNPLTVGHWSEVAKYGQYRPPAFTPVANPTQSGCPHLQSDVVYWHDSGVWSVPSNGSDVTIPANTKMVVASCSIPASYIFGIVTIPASSQLIFPDAPVTFQARGFQVSGALLAGSPTCRLRNKVTITLWGRRGAQSLPADPKVKGIAVYGTIDIHGAQYFPTWTRLAMTASVGDNIIFVQDIVNWQPGQQIVITTTELKDARDFTHNEVRTIVAVSRTTLDSTVAAIEVDAPLTYRHYGGREYQAEVSLLSRNIVIQGDPVNSEPTDTSKPICKDSDNNNLDSPTGSTYPCDNQFLTGFGGHVQVIGESSVGRFSGVELYRMGQTNQMARYPLHFHLMGQKDPSTAFAQDCSVHRSFFRCYVIHGTHNAVLTQNTAYDAIGNCFYLSEDGVEENSTISYNFAAYVHPLGNPAITTYVDKNTKANIDGNGWYGQYLDYYNSNANLLIPADLSAACFYITNGYNHIIGNAASGGWTGFSFPSLIAPIGDYRWVNNTNPSGRPFASPMRGNTAHSSGFWWASAGAFYFGGVLEYTDNKKNTLHYTAGRSLYSHDTCADTTAGTPVGAGGCWDDIDQLWLRMEDNKAFLANRGLQAWGNRAEIIRMELHDVALSMNVFGQVWIDQLLMDCRSNNTVTWFAGCPTAPPVSQRPPWGACSVRDWYFFNSLHGFQWYDVGQRHILSNSTFRNCRNDWYGCIYGPSAGICNSAVFQSLTHSDQFVPELMQVTKSIRFENSNNLRSFTTTPPPTTISSRLQSWFDADGSVSGFGVPTMIGSNRSNHWWDTTQNCPVADQAYMCALNQNDGAASVVLQWNANRQNQIGSSVCGNGNNLPCPVVGKVTHFGREEGTGLDLGVNTKITGPIIYESGGWFIRLNDGTPRVVSFTQIQVAPTKSLLVALPYPSGTTFNITYQAASWCGSSWATCVHIFRAADSIQAVAEGPGDLYYFANGILYVRIVMQPDLWPKGDPAAWSGLWTSPSNFSRNGLTLYETSASSVRIQALNCGKDPCAAQTNAKVPTALHPGSATTAITRTTTTVAQTSSTSSTSATGTNTGTGTGTTTGTTTGTATSTSTRSSTNSGGNGGGSSSGCFAASSTVRVLHGETVISKPLADLAVGERVESFAGNQRIFSEVYYIAHDGDQSLTELVQLSVAKSSAVLKLTANHLVLVADNLGSSPSLQAAGLIKEGQFLFRLNEEGVLAPAAVVAVSRTKEAVRNPLTLNGHIVVSDLACSTFVYSDSLYRVLVAPLQAVYQLAPSLLQRGSLLTSVVDLIVQLTDIFESVFTMPFVATLSAY